MEELFSVLLEAVFTVVGVLIAGGVAYFTPKLKRHLDLLVDRDNLGIIETVVDMGVELVEENFKGESGEEKFKHASGYVAMMAKRYGIEVSSEFIEGAVQNGYRRMVEKQNYKEDK